MHLSTLLQGLYSFPEENSLDITGLSLDSRQVAPGELFMACLGSQKDGRQFIQDAIQKGAKAVLAESDEPLYFDNGVPVISIPGLRQQVSEIAAKFYGYPAKSIEMIGVTGTNGKTSCSHFVAEALQHLSIPCGIIGTLGIGLHGELQATSLTTPDAVTLQKTLASFLKKGVKHVAMEVSSHSIDQGRIASIPFKAGIFTNLTRDHLDYHGTMEAYGAAKRKLFDNPLLKYSIINQDDSFGREMLGSLSGDNHFSYGISHPGQVSADHISLHLSGMAAHIVSPWGEGKLQLSLIGQFNLHNILAVLATLCVLDIPFTDALASLSHISPVSGRMQAFGGGDKPLVIVDYSHTPDSLEKALSALRPHCQGQLHCVFGCGGDRDKGKRPLMAKIAEQYADSVVVTDDNPRTEDPDAITTDIFQGFNHPERVILQHDRSKAIRDVIQYAKMGDCILIAGKGAETYQQIGDQKIPFSDIEKVKESL